MVAAIQPVFGDDGTFWMCFEDFVQHFRAVNVCKVKDWEEVRVKGEFTNFSHDPNVQSLAPQSLRSRYFYEIQVPPTEKKQRIHIGVHLEDLRVQDLAKRRP